MDMMSRREIMGKVLAAMASGAQFEKGTFTVPDNASTVTINFSKSFSKYFYLIEMTDASKSMLLQTGIDGYKAFALIGSNPMPKINSNIVPSVFVTSRVNPSSGEVSTSTNGPSSMSDSSIRITAASISANATNYLWRGYTYNYYIVEIK